MLSASHIWISIIFILLFSYIYRVLYPFPPPIAVGIDIGTTFSSLAVFNVGKGNVTIISDVINRKLIPSIVTFYEDGSIIPGSYPHYSEKRRFVTIYDSKRFIGKSNISDFQSNKYPFEIRIINGSTYFQLPTFFKSNYKDNLVSPFNVTSILVSYLKDMFKLHYGYYPKMCVVGVPVEFDTAQRSATQSAVESNNLRLLRLVNEPIAAAMACDIFSRTNVEHIVVFDLGGGTLDVSVLSVNQNSLNTISIAGDEFLGGRDFTNQLSKCILDKLSSYNLSFVKNEYPFFLKQVEAAKIQLSDQILTTISFSFGSNEINITVSAEEFQSCTQHLFDSLLLPIQLALKEANLTIQDIQEIVLVGGSTRMPYLRHIISQYFNKLPNLSVDPDTAVVIGLAHQAGILTQGWPLDKLAVDVPQKKLHKHTIIH